MSVLIIGCGALGKELAELRRVNEWTHVAIQCLPAELHNRPERIAPAVRDLIEKNRVNHEHIFVAYADCGTGGQLDRVLADYGIERLPGAHCYEFFAGPAPFRDLSDAEPGTFYLTDFLTRNFDRLVRRGLGLDRHPHLLPVYFGNYKRLVYISQQDDPALDTLAREHATYLGLAYERHHGGLEPLGHLVADGVVRWQN